MGHVSSIRQGAVEALDNLVTLPDKVASSAAGAKATADKLSGAFRSADNLTVMRASLSAGAAKVSGKGFLATQDDLFAQLAERIGPGQAIAADGMTMREVREALGVSMRDLEEVSGVARSTIAEWETGGDCNPAFVSALHNGLRKITYKRLQTTLLCTTVLEKAANG